MCTIGYCANLNMIFKNRDKLAAQCTAEEIVSSNSTLAARTVGSNYYSWGMNINGCAFVSTAVNTPKWCKLVYSGKQKEADDQYRLENEGLSSPMEVVSSMLANVNNVQQWIDALNDSRLMFMGYNILVADTQSAYLVEVYQEKRVMRKLTQNEAITNHFQTVDHGPEKNEDYPSTFRRLEYASSKIKDVDSTSDILQIVKPLDNSDKTIQIWRNGGVFETISSSIIDFGEGTVCYAKSTEDQLTNLRLQNSEIPQTPVKGDGEDCCFEMSRYIDLELYHKVEGSHPFYTEMVQAICDTIKDYCDAGKKYRVLEVGAGTGLFTASLLEFLFLEVTALEIDIECCEILKNYLKYKKSVEIIQGDAVTYCEPEKFDLVVSTFAHDHICYDDAEKFVKNIYNNTKDGGLYIMGGEILPKYKTNEERENALYLYHGMIIDRAIKSRDYRLAQIEINALESGVEMVGDFKRHEELFEKEMKTGGFSLSSKEKMGPLDDDSVGGVFVYVYKK